MHAPDESEKETRIGDRTASGQSLSINFL